MSRNNNHLWIHCVWCVKYRRSVLDDDVMDELRSFINNHFKERNYEITCCNGYRDHLHILVRLGLDGPISQVAKDIKGATSRWINKEGKIPGRFAWQRGFSAYSVSPQDVGTIIKYIENQQIHHGPPPPG